MAHVLTCASFPQNSPCIAPDVSFTNIFSFRVTSSAAFASTSTPRKRTVRRKQQPADGDLPAPALVSASALEKALRFTFMEELMVRARSRDVSGASEVIYDMIAAGLRPGPRSFHGLIVAHVLAGDEKGALQSFRRELTAGLRPFHETYVALVRLFGSKGHAKKGEAILASMENLNFDVRQAWMVLVEELVRNECLEDANRLFLKGAEGGLRATDELYDLLIEVDCKAGDHSNALTIAYEMEAAGRMATTFHFNCLLSVQATCGIPEIAFSTFENMEYGEDYMKPNTETYNWVIQAYTRAESYDRVQDVAELLGMMIEDHKRLQPDVKTYALLVECFTKYCVVREAIRHFRGLKNFEGGTRVLHDDGNFGDPLSLYLRALCREGRIVELLEALEAMDKDNQPIPPRAMILSRKYRTLVSSWIEPLHEEAELGFDIDYIARYIAEGGLTGERKRWVPRRGKAPLDPDCDGFVYSTPIEVSFKQRCLEEWQAYHEKLLKTLQNEGPKALQGASESDYLRVLERLKKIVKGRGRNILKPKAASKMTVSELRDELEAQDLPVDGTKNFLYQRVQKARRINLSRGRPLWVPPVENAEEEVVDEVMDELISRIKLEEGNTELWRRRFIGEDLNDYHEKPISRSNSEVMGTLNVTDMVDFSEKEVDDAEVDEDAEMEQTETHEVDEVKDDGVEALKPTQMIGVQLLKDDQTLTTSKKSRSKASQRFLENDDDDDWFPVDLIGAFKELRERQYFDVSDIYTIADAWGWTWERELKNKPPRRWSQKWEVELAVEVMLKVIRLGGAPTISDCAMILRAAINSPLPSSFLTILSTSHSLGYVFGSPLYEEVVSLCLDLEERDVAVAVVADMESSGITVSDRVLGMVLSAKQSHVVADDAT